MSILCSTSEILPFNGDTQLIIFNHSKHISLLFNNSFAPLISLSVVLRGFVHSSEFIFLILVEVKFDKRLGIVLTNPDLESIDTAFCLTLTFSRSWEGTVNIQGERVVSDGVFGQSWKLPAFFD